MSLSKSAKYYRSHPEARAKKAATDAKINKRPEQVKKRVELNKINRTSQNSGKTSKKDGKDYDHAVGRFVKESVNRGRNEKSRLKGSKRD